MRKRLRRNLVQIDGAVPSWRELPRKRRSEPKREEQPVEEMGADPWPSIDDRLDALTLINRFADRLRTALTMTMHGYTQEEIADVLDVSARQVRRMLDILRGENQ